MPRKIRIKRYRNGSGGWGSVRSLAKILWREKVPPVQALTTLMRQNKPGGFMCVSCAWPKPAEPHTFEFCENGAKATAWEITSLRCGPDFFAQHTLAALREWPDHDLEQQGRLTHPLRYDRAQDKYVPATWDEAIAAIGTELKALREQDRKSVVFYASGRASLETSYAWALFARMYGNNNLPDSSNMCHESTSVGLRQSLGVPVGTCVLEDFRFTDCIVLLGQNAPTNSPRFLHDLQQAAERGVPILVFNPLREGGLEKFGNPQDPVTMITGNKTRIASHWYQVRAGGDIAAITGIAKALFNFEDAGRRVLDTEFIAQHTHGFDAYAAHVRGTSWDAIERESGLARAQLEEAAGIYANAKAVMGVYGMGLTQHRGGVQNVHAVCNLLLLRGNVGRPGAGASPVRGHSNVQGQRTVGIADRVALVPLDRFAAQYGFEPPREDGLNTVGTCEGVMGGSVRAFLGLGGNFLRAAPETERLERAWPSQRLTVHIATKLNRTHLIPGEISYVLPCLGRSERDMQASGAQAVSMEDSTSCIHGSRGNVRPAHELLRSELWIVAQLAKATLPPNPKLDWNAWVGDYAKVRDAIEQTYPDMFREFNKRLWQPGGFHKGNAARERKWNTSSGKANFLVPPSLSATGFENAPDDVLRLTTVRSNDQFNTTIYGYDDRFRGIHGTRMVVMMSAEDARRFALAENDEIALTSAAGDNVERTVRGLRVLIRELPRGTVAAYYPECNPLIPVWHHASESHVPAGEERAGEDPEMTTEAETLHDAELSLEDRRSGPWQRCESAPVSDCRSGGSRDQTPMLPKGVVMRPVIRTRNGVAEPVIDHIAEEIPIALIYNDTPFAVMMATPADFEDFALGFSITESIVANANEILAIEHRELLEGHELRITIPRSRADELAARRRNLTGRSGCGLCGTEMLEAAMREPPPVPPTDFELTNNALQRAIDQLPHHQPINALTGATHAAAWCDADGNIQLAREDVGRHNALDKLVGAMRVRHVRPDAGFALVTSRASYEIVAKSATAGVASIAALSAPTALAISLAKRTGISLIAFARSGSNATRVAASAPTAIPLSGVAGPELHHGAEQTRP